MKLSKTGALFGDALRLSVTYQDRNGRMDGSETTITLDRQKPEFFENSGIRKAVLLTRYAALIKDWIVDERQHAHLSAPWEPCVDEVIGIALPPDSYLGQWERTSLPLMVSAPYKRWLSEFRSYMESEMYAINDDTLNKELDILDYLVKYR